MMFMKFEHLLVPVLIATPLLADSSVRIGLDTQATEWIVSMPGGGQVCGRDGRVMMTLRPGERLRVWWDSRGEADSNEEYRLQVGPPLALKATEATQELLRKMGEAPELVRVADGDTWRVLIGHFARPIEAEPLMDKLAAAGVVELWVSTEKRPVNPRKGRALYAVTEQYERLPLPKDGVRFKPKDEPTSVQGKGRYRGNIDIFPNPQGRLTVMNTVDLETYLRGVVPREMSGGEFPALEALKAQAVAARTYAFVNKGKRAAEGFDLVDTVADQVYGGRDAEQSLTDLAVRETSGLIATYQGKPIQALFMANSGAATIDNTHVFGGGQEYLRGVSNYPDNPLTIHFTGLLAPVAQDWVSLDLLKLVGADIIPISWLDGDLLAKPLKTKDFLEPVTLLAQRLAFTPPTVEQEEGSAALLWMARSLGLGRVPAGMERAQDAEYFLRDVKVGNEDRQLATFLTRRGIVPRQWWSESSLTRRQGLQVLARMWQELETVDFSEGTLQKNGQVRQKGQEPQPLNLAPQLILAEEAPGGFLRLVKESRIQIGDRVRWMRRDGGSSVLVRRMDPDGASWNRYNPTAHWRIEVKEAELLTRLRDRVNFKSIHAIRTSSDEYGRVTELAITDENNRVRKFTGMRIRGILGIKDNAFSFVETGTKPNRRWIFFGRGWGHGVGMDQTGAYGMAMEGATFDQILKHYYQGIELRRIE
jgi:stage II sporulation protein D